MNSEKAKKVFEGEIFTVWQWEQELYDGSVATFERVTRMGAANVIGVLPNMNILLAVDEQPHREPVLTAPGGRMEEGESAEEAARREFLEETGYAIGDLRPFYTYSTSDKVRFVVTSFIGRKLEKVADPTPEPGERIGLKEYSFEDFLHLGRSDSEEFGGPIRDWKLRTLLLEALLDEAKKKELYRMLYE